MGFNAIRIFMSISFKPAGQGVSFGKESCGICLNDDNTQTLKNHTENGEKHIFHASCIDTWIKINPSCPNCRRHVVLPLKDKIITELKNMGKDAFFGACYGAALAVVGGEVTEIVEVTEIEVAGIAGAAICAAAGAIVIGAVGAVGGAVGVGGAAVIVGAAGGAGGLIIVGFLQRKFTRL
jgi:hypothetical protein